MTSISPDLQRTTAQNIHATTGTVAAGHLPMLSQPAQVANFIGEAAQQVGNQ